MLSDCIRTAGFIIASFITVSACQGPTTPSAALPFDTRPRITEVAIASDAPTPTPVPVNVQGAFFQNGLRLTVRAPNAQLLQIEGPEIQHLTRSSFDVRLPMTVAGVYYFSVQNTQGLSSQAFQVTVGG